MIDKELPTYQSHKQVKALEIKEITALGTIGNKLQYKLSFKDETYKSIAIPAEMCSRYTPIEGDYYVVYKDGYESFSPRKEFLDGYTKI